MNAADPAAAESCKLRPAQDSLIWLVANDGEQTSRALDVANKETCSKHHEGRGCSECLELGHGSGCEARCCHGGEASRSDSSKASSGPRQSSCQAGRGSCQGNCRKGAQWAAISGAAARYVCVQACAD